MHKPIVLMIVAAAFAFGAPAQAANLTSKQVKGTIAAFPEMTKLAKKYKIDESASKPNGSLDFQEEFRKSMKKLRASGGYAEARGVVRKHGFSSPEQWMDVTARVMRAYVALRIGPRMAASKAQMDQSMAMVQNNPQFSAAQKQQLMAQMSAAMKMMKELENVPAADKAAVQPHMAAMTAVMRSMPKAEGGSMGGPMGGSMRR